MTQAVKSRFQPHISLRLLSLSFYCRGNPCGPIVPSSIVGEAALACGFWGFRVAEAGTCLSIFSKRN